MPPEIVKTCIHHGDLVRDQVQIDYWVKGKRSYIRCKQCIYDKNLRYFTKQKLNPEYQACKQARDKAGWVKNKVPLSEQRKSPENLARRRDWYKTNSANVLAKCKVKQKAYRGQLADTYLRRLIQDGKKYVKFSHIPQSMIDFKRSIMQLKRSVKQKQTSQLGEQIAHVTKKYRAITKRSTRQSGKLGKK